MRGFTWLFAVLVVGGLQVGGQASTVNDLASKVNLFIGTTSKGVASGHAFPGATIPHGMIKAGMDTDSPDRHAGYDRNTSYNATGFSQLHDSGTGGGYPLSNFKIWPFASCKRFAECPTSIAGRRLRRQPLKDGSSPDIAEPGYFATQLVSGVGVELTSTRRAALHRYTFPKSSKEPRILVDITNDGQQSATDPIAVIDTKTGRIKGGASFAGSFGPGRYRAYVCVDVKGAGFETKVTEYGVWQGNSAVKGSVSLSQLYLGSVNEAGSLVTYSSSTGGSNTTLLVRVGVSFISADQACASAEEEIPDFGFDRVRAESRAKWNELLGRVRVDETGVDKNTTALLYSSMYRTAIVPANYTGENPRWKSSSPYFDSYYCNWDSYRTLYPWYAMTDPRSFAQIVEAQIDIWRNEGWLPECRGATVQHYIQGSSNADPILAEFLIKWGSRAAELGVTVDDLYAALITDAEKQSDNWNLQGRQAEVWKQYGYVPCDIWEPSGANTKQASRSVEYAFGDFCISQVAKALNKTDDHLKYSKRAANFMNSWDRSVSIAGHHGFIQNKYQNGTFNFTDPRHCSIHDPLKSTCYLNAVNTDGFYESSPIVYSQYVPHDNAKLIELQGGKDAFGYFEVSNEPSQQMPFMYHYAGQPGRSTQRSREVISKFYNLTDTGIPGNDDSGAMASFAAFYLVGLYPLPATRQVLISSPWFPTVNITNSVTGATTTINAVGFKGNPSGSQTGNIFVQNIKRRHISILEPLGMGIIETGHIFSSLPLAAYLPPYSSTIIAITLALRTGITLPMAIWSRARAYRREHIVGPELQAWREKTKEVVGRSLAREGKPYEEYRAEMGRLQVAKLKELNKIHHCSPLPTMIAPFAVHAPLFILATASFRQAALMHAAPMNPLALESFLTLPSLAHVDPTGVLPIAVGLLMFSNVELGRLSRPAKQATPASNNSSSEASTAEPPRMSSLVTALENGLRGASILFIWVAMQSPGAVVLYWLTSASYTLVERIFFIKFGKREPKRVDRPDIQPAAPSISSEGRNARRGKP